jgi:hypothetical protein
MWQEQFISIVEGNSLDPDHIADLLITYEAETGDPSLRGCGVEVLMFVGALRHWPASWFGPRSTSMSISWFRSRSESRSRSGSGSLFRPRSWSWSGSRLGFRSRSLSGFRSWSGSRLF